MCVELPLITKLIYGFLEFAGQYYLIYLFLVAIYAVTFFYFASKKIVKLAELCSDSESFHRFQLKTYVVLLASIVFLELIEVILNFYVVSPIIKAAF